MISLIVKVKVSVDIKETLMMSAIRIRLSLKQPLLLNNFEGNKYSFDFRGGGSTSKGSNQKPKNNITVNQLQQHHVRQFSAGGQVKVTTMALHKLLPEDREKLAQLEKQKSDSNKKALLVLV